MDPSIVVLVTHLLHTIPVDVGKDFSIKCGADFPNSPFSQGYCVDRLAGEWLQVHKNYRAGILDEKPTGNTTPNLLDNQIPDLIIKPGKD